MKTRLITDCDGTIQREKLTIGRLLWRCSSSSVLCSALRPSACQARRGPGASCSRFHSPPVVMEQNGSLTGFVIDLWNAIATRLKVKTNYQILPDVRALEEAMRSKSADLTPAIVITSAARCGVRFFVSNI